MSEQSLSDFPRLAGAWHPPCPCPQGYFCGTTSRRLAWAPTAALIHVPTDSEEKITSCALSASASSALCLGSPGPSHHLLLGDPALGLPLGKGRWSALLGTRPDPLGTCSALLARRPVHLWEMCCPTEDMSCPPAQCSLCAQVTGWLGVPSKRLSGACTQAPLCTHADVGMCMDSHAHAVPACLHPGQGRVISGRVA